MPRRHVQEADAHRLVARGGVAGGRTAQKAVRRGRRGRRRCGHRARRRAHGAQRARAGQRAGRVRDLAVPHTSSRRAVIGIARCGHAKADRAAGRIRNCSATRGRWRQVAGWRPAAAAIRMAAPCRAACNRGAVNCDPRKSGCALRLVPRMVFTCAPAVPVPTRLARSSSQTGRRARDAWNVCWAAAIADRRRSRRRQDEPGTPRRSAGAGLPPVQFTPT